jgi:hypothetical protein
MTLHPSQNEYSLAVAVGLTPKTDALRYNAGKIMLSLVPSSLVRYVGAVLTYGAEKYAPHNWRKGFPWSSITDSLERHLAAWKEGEEIDPESGLPHLAHVACNAAFLIEHFDAGLGVDDRVRVPTERRQLKWNAPPPKQ